MTPVTIYEAGARPRAPRARWHRLDDSRRARRRPHAPQRRRRARHRHGRRASPPSPTIRPRSGTTRRAPRSTATTSATSAARSSSPQRATRPTRRARSAMAGSRRRSPRTPRRRSIPVIGVSTRFGFGKTAPTRFAFSCSPTTRTAARSATPKRHLATIDPTRKPRLLGISATQILDFELTPTLAYQVNDVFSVGAGLRIGINSFSVNDTERRSPPRSTARASGIGGILGVMVRPHPLVADRRGLSHAAVGVDQRQRARSRRQRPRR